MYDLTDDETALAKAQGWSLHTVHDAKRWRVMILPAFDAITRFNTAPDAGTYVVSMARLGHALHIKALRAVMANTK